MYNKTNRNLQIFVKIGRMQNCLFHQINVREGPGANTNTQKLAT